MIEIVLAFISGSLFGVGAIVAFALWYENNKKA